MENITTNDLKDEGNHTSCECGNITIYEYSWGNDDGNTSCPSCMVEWQRNQIKALKELLYELSSKTKEETAEAINKKYAEKPTPAEKFDYKSYYDGLRAAATDGLEKIAAEEQKEVDHAKKLNEEKKISKVQLEEAITQIHYKYAIARQKIADDESKAEIQAQRDRFDATAYAQSLIDKAPPGTGPLSIDDKATQDKTAVEKKSQDELDKLNQDRYLGNLENDKLSQVMFWIFEKYQKYVELLPLAFRLL